MDETWTINELVAEVERRIEALPRPANGQVRAVPDDRTIRYYAAIGLLDRPAAMRGRTALYGRKHVAQVVAIKRLQTMGRSLAEIQVLWPTLDDATLSRMSGIELFAMGAAKSGRKEFWKTEPTPVAPPPPTSKSPTAPPASPPAPAPAPPPMPAPRGRAPHVAGEGDERAPQIDDSTGPGDATASAVAATTTEPHVAPAQHIAATTELRIALAPHISLSIALSDDIAVSLADVAAIRAAAAPLIAELARRRLAVHAGEGEDV